MWAMMKKAMLRATHKVSTVTSSQVTSQVLEKFSALLVKISMTRSSVHEAAQPKVTRPTMAASAPPGHIR